MAEVEPEWKNDFGDFIDLGVARREFLDHLNNCSNCQKAVNEVFEMQAKGLVALAKALKYGREERKRKREGELKQYGFWKRIWYRIFGQP